MVAWVKVPGLPHSIQLAVIKNVAVVRRLQVLQSQRDVEKRLETERAGKCWRAQSIKRRAIRARGKVIVQSAALEKKSALLSYSFGRSKDAHLMRERLDVPGRVDFLLANHIYDVEGFGRVDPRNRATLFHNELLLGQPAIDPQKEGPDRDSFCVGIHWIHPVILRALNYGMDRASITRRLSGKLFSLTVCPYLLSSISCSENSNANKEV